MDRIKIATILLAGILLSATPYLPAQNPTGQLQALLRKKANAAGGGATATDTFNRADADPISVNMSDGSGTWDSGPGAANDVQISANEATGSTGATNIGRVSSPTFSSNQESSVTIGDNGISSGMGAVVRIQSTSDASGYMLFADSTTSLTIYRIDDTGTIGFTALGASYTVSTLGVGDVLKITANGTTLAGFLNGSSIGTTRTDSTYSSGQPGIYTSSANPGIDDFTASDL